MVVLKKIKGSTLMETLVATVLIVVIFMLSSMILNNLFSNSIKNNTTTLRSHLNELQYLQQYNQIQLPYRDAYNNWDISITKFKEGDKALIEFSAIHTETKKMIQYITHERP